jgi:hypothetical protein
MKDQTKQVQHQGNESLEEEQLENVTGGGSCSGTLRGTRSALETLHRPAPTTGPTPTPTEHSNPDPLVLNPSGNLPRTIASPRRYSHGDAADESFRLDPR